MTGRDAYLIAAIVFGQVAVSSAAEVQTQPATAPAVALPAPGFVDEALFRESLRRRGLGDWLGQYAADSQPADEIDSQFRRREVLLARLNDARLPFYERQQIVSQAGSILTGLINAHPEHPSSLWWRFELARDALDRTDPQAFESVLLYDLPGRDRTAVSALSARAIERLHDLQQRIAATWTSAGNLDETGLAAMEASGWLRALESLDQQAAGLLAWAKLYQAICAYSPGEAAAAALNDLLVMVTEQYHWTQAENHDAALRANMLVLAAIAARHAGKLEQADQYARQVVSIASELVDARQRRLLEDGSLLAILEQIRVLRDAGKRSDALKGVDTARAWARKTRPDRIEAVLAGDLLECSILAGGNSGRPPAASLLAVPEALVPLEVFASKSIPQREALYAALAGAMAGEPVRPDLTAFALQLLAGAAVHDAEVRLPPDRRAGDARLAAVAAALQQAATSQPAGGSPAEWGELMYLDGRALYLAGRRLEASGVLADLVEKLPDHDRSESAARRAVAIAQELLADKAVDVKQVRAAFVRAGRLLRKKLPDAEASRRLQYFIAQALEADGRLHEAAGEYAAVPADDPNAARAALRRARCLRTLLQAALADTKRSPADLKSLMDETLQAARAGAASKATRPAATNEADACLAAEQILLLANLLNYSAVSQSAEVLRALEGFEQRVGKCPSGMGQALRERIVALRELKRMGEARRVVEQYLKAEPEQAGAVMTRLLAAMHEEIEAAEDRNDAQTLQSVAAEAAELARSLLAWSDARPGRMTPADRLTIAVWRAAATLHAGRADEAIKLYDACLPMADQLPGEHKDQDMEIRLGRAESLLALGKAADALPVFADLWQKLPEESPPWWRAFVGQLQCHAALGHDPDGIRQAIVQRRYLSPGLGGPRYRRTIEAIEQASPPRASQPAQNR